MNNFKPFSSEKLKPQIAYTEMKLKVLITNIEKRLDKNQKDFWIIRTQLGEFAQEKSYLAFSTDYNLVPKTKSLLENYYEKLKGRMVLLTIRKAKDKEKVIEMEVEKN